MMETDVVIVGGGVAGLSAAIAAVGAGLRTVVLERKTHPPERPGETLHPGAEAVFNLLGITGQVEAATTLRHRGIIVCYDGNSFAEPYGGPPAAPWRGYQIKRDRLHDILLGRARKLGANVRFSSPANALHEDSNNILVVDTPHGAYATKWLLDGSGVSNWSAREDQVGYRVASTKLAVCYGYSTSDRSVAALQWPTLSLGSWGWAWDAYLGDGRTAWVKLFNCPRAMQKSRPANSHTADGTWRIATEPAQANRFRIGDSALRMDPSSGRGVLRAMMSAIMAVHLVKAVIGGNIPHHAAARIYSDWITQWFESDARELSQLLGRAGKTDWLSIR